VPKILVSYRREDSAAYAGRLSDRLAEHFGRDNVFIDIDTIKPGEDFVDVIERSVSSCDVLVALIGKTWLTGTDAAGRRRLDRSDDFVRTEIATALSRQIRVIPALVGGAVMPEASELPTDLSKITRRQAIEISDSRFHQDADRLIEALSDALSDRTLQERPRPAAISDTHGKSKPPMWPWLAGAIAVVLLAIAGYWRFVSRDAISGGSVAVVDAPEVQSRGTPRFTGRTGATAPTRGGAVSGSSTSNDSPGKTGIRIIWRGATSVPCFLYDETGQKLLSPSGVISSWRCEPGDAAPWDAAPRKYLLKVDAPGVDLVPITVTAGKVELVEPKIGQVHLHWSGSNKTLWFLWDKDGQKALSPTGVISAWDCEAGMTCKQDVGSGDYLIKVSAVAAEPVPIRVTAGKVLQVEPRIGQIRLHWNGSNTVRWYLWDKDGQKALSPQGVISAWDCEAGKTCTQDVGPGNYLVKVDAVGYEPVKVSVAPSRVTEVRLP
jgi:TIR domain